MRHYTKAGEPLSCPRCDATALNREKKAPSVGYTSEFAVRCAACRAVIGYWAYGVWDQQVATHWQRYARKRNPALPALWRALRSLGRAIIQDAKRRL